MIFEKGKNLQLNEVLNTSDIECKCDRESCHYTIVNPRMIDEYMQLCDIFKLKLYVTSWFRCQANNEFWKGEKKSKHTIGLAIDVACPVGMDFKMFMNVLEKFSNAELIPYQDKNFCHLELSDY